jgi:hypothetical protein
LFVASLHHSRRFPAKFLEGRFENRPAGIENNGPICLQAGQLRANGFPHTSANPVSNSRLSDGAWQRETDSGRLIGVGPRGEAKCCKVSAGHTSSRLINFAKFGRPEKTVCLWQ